MVSAIATVSSVAISMGAAAALGYDHLPAGQAAQNEVMNNYLDHRRPQMLRLSEKECYENAVQGCANGNQAACRVRDELAALSRARDIRLRNACNGSNPALCNELAREATEMGNVVYGRQGGFVYANSPKPGPIRRLNTETISAPSRLNNFHDELARSTLDAVIMESGNIVADATLGLAGNWFSKLQGWGTTKALGKLEINKNNTFITFGRVNNQISHTFRHVESAGYDRSAIQNAITSDVARLKNTFSTNPYNGFVIVDGVKFNYVAYRLPDGTLNIGCITPPR